MRRFILRCLSVLALCLAVLSPGPLTRPATAQEAPAVGISLISQSIWNGPGRPLEVRFQVTNGTDTPLEGLTAVLTIQAHAGSRSEYQLSLVQDQTPDLFSYPFPETGRIEPGQSRDFTVRQELPFLNENGLYPVRIVMLSQSIPVATLRTPMVFLAEQPQTPLHLTWTWVLSEPLQFGPDRVFAPGPVEADIAPGGRVDTMVRAMDAATPAPIDLAMSPVLAEELRLMQSGYRITDSDGTIREVPAGTAGAADAARLLELLRKIAGRPKTELLALPFGDVRLPALFAAGLGQDLATLITRGRLEVGSALGADPSDSVFRPPLSQVDTGTADRLAAMGVSTLVLSHQTIQIPAGLSPNPSPIVRLADTPNDMVGVVEDGELATVVSTYHDDPQLAAHVALGQLASVWLEAPGTPGRGVAMLFPEEPSYPLRFFRPFVTLARNAPWLRVATATGMVSLAQNTGQDPIPPAGFRGYQQNLMQAVSDARRRISLFSATAGRAGDLTTRLESAVLYAESGTSITRPTLGFSYVDWIDRQIRTAYGRVLPPDPDIPRTLVSQRGSTPFDFRNDNVFPVRVAIRLVADRRLLFPSGNVRTVTLLPNRLTRVFFDVQAQTTGRFPIKLQILPPVSCGNCTIAETRMIVRSTAYNRVALVMTIGAALFLMGWWGKRLLFRPRP